MRAVSISRLQRLSRTLFRIGYGLRVHGLSRVPRVGGLIVVSNHISDYDPPVLGSSIPRRIWIMAKRELFESGFGSFVFPKMGAFPVNRQGIDTNSIRMARNAIDSGKAVVIFPEGTRSRTAALMPMKPGVGLLASITGAPVLPAFVWGTNRPFEAMLRKTHFEVHFGQLVDPKLIADTKDHREAARIIGRSIASTALEAGHPEAISDSFTDDVDTRTERRKER